MMLGSLAMAGCGSDALVVDADDDGFESLEDCDDGDASIHPGAPERCDGEDQDCDGEIDEDAVDALEVWPDADGDGFGAGEAVPRCDRDGFTTLGGGDCDDLDASIHPDANERCDEVDRNCDGDPYAGAVDTEQAYLDADGDGFAGSPSREFCVLPPGGSWTRDDCDDSDFTVYPGAEERCDQTDQDCDGSLGFDGIVGLRDGAQSVTAVVNTVGDGGTVCVLAGTWPARIDLDSRDLTLVGEGGGRTALVPDGRLLNLEGADVRLVDVDIVMQEPPRTNMVEVRRGALELERVHIDVLTPAEGAFGGLIRGKGTEITLRDVSVAGVRRDEGTWVLYAEDSDVVVEGLDVRELTTRGSLLTAITGSFRGSDITVRDLTTFEGYEAIVAAGRVLDTFHIQDLDVDGVEVLDEPHLTRASRSLVIAYSDPTTLQGVRVRRVLADDGVWVRALALGSGDVTASDIDVQSSTLMAPGGVAFVGTNSRADLTGIRVHDVTAESLLAARWSRAGVPVTVRNLISSGNHRIPDPYLPVGWLDLYAGVDRTGGPFRVENAVFLDEDMAGGGGRLVSSVRVEVDLANIHVGAGFIGPIDDPAVRLDDATCTLDHSSHAPLPIHDQGFTLGDRVFGTDDPGFVDVSATDPAAWDLHLQETSPLVDAGDPSILDVDGSRSDIGAYGGPGGAW